MKKIILLIIEKIRKVLKVDENGNSFGWGKGMLLLAALMMVGCDQQKIPNDITKDDFGVCVYDSCEYLIAAHGYKGFLVHKGNCRFCKERKQKEIKEL